MGRGKHCSNELREIIKKLREEGKSYQKIADQLGCSKKKVENAVKYEPKPEKRGKKPKISEKMERTLLRHVRKDPFVTSTALKREYNLDVDTSTIRKLLIKNNLKAKSPRKVPLLLKIHVQNRLSFAKEHVNWPITKWRNILWSDESKVNLFNSDRTNLPVRRPPNTEHATSMGVSARQ